jgi:hypothetical protein
MITWICFFFLLLFWGYLWNLQVYHTEFTPSNHSPLSFPPTIPGIVLISLIFPFTCMCTQYLHHIHPLWPYPHLLPLPLVPSPNPTLADKTCSVLLFSDFVKEKKMKFLFKKATQGVFLWHLHVYMYYNPNWFVSSIFLLSTLVPFLWWFQ